MKDRSLKNFLVGIGALCGIFLMAAAVLAVIVGGGCVPATPKQPRSVTIMEEAVVVTLVAGYLPDGFHRIVDHEAGQVCYLLVMYRPAGVDCVPLSETTLDGGR